MNHENESAEANAAGMDLAREMERRLRCDLCGELGTVGEHDGKWYVSAQCPDIESYCQSGMKPSKESAIQAWEQLHTEAL